MTDIKDQTKRKNEIALLQAVVDKNEAAIAVTEAILQRQRANQVNRLAELRVQKLLLNMAERAALKAAKATPV